MKSLRRRVITWVGGLLAVVFAGNLATSYVDFKAASREGRMEKYRVYLSPTLTAIEKQRETYDPELEHVLNFNKVLVDLKAGDPLLLDLSLFDLQGRRLLYSDTSIDFTELRQPGQLQGIERLSRRQEPFLDKQTDAYYFPLMAIEEGAGARRVFGLVQLRIDPPAERKAVLKAILRHNLVVLAGFIIIGLGVFATITIQVRQPLLQLVDFSRRVAARDFQGRIPAARRKDEIGTLTGAFISMLDNLKEILGKIQGASLELTEVSAEVDRLMNTLVENSRRQSGGTEETATFVEENTRTVQNISDHTRTLSQSATEGASSILEMGATIEEVAETVDQQTRLVGEVSRSIEQMVGTADRIADSVAALSSSSEETSFSMSQMDQSIKQINAAVDQAGEISETVRQKAQAGQDAVTQTQEGIGKIRSSSETAHRVIVDLAGRAEEIGNVLNVIDDVIEETNLLSLNAAILAAQAGEHGKGFEVVADEIKDLADRTASSSKEISGLIQAVQRGARDAAHMMHGSAEDVTRGESLARQASTELAEILASVERFNDRVRGIGRETSEIANGSRQITKAVQSVSHALREIEDATGRQKSENEKLLGISRRMNDMTLQVKRTADEQAIASRQITGNIENIREMVQHIERSTSEQSLESNKILAEITGIRDLTTENVEALAQVHRIVRNLNGLAEMLKKDVDEFKL